MQTNGWSPNNLCLILKKHNNIVKISTRITTSKEDMSTYELWFIKTLTFRGWNCDWQLSHKNETINDRHLISNQHYRFLLRERMEYLKADQCFHWPKVENSFVWTHQKVAKTTRTRESKSPKKREFVGLRWCFATASSLRVFGHSGGQQGAAILVLLWEESWCWRTEKCPQHLQYLGIGMAREAPKIWSVYLSRHLLKNLKSVRGDSLKGFVENS